MSQQSAPEPGSAFLADSYASSLRYQELSTELHALLFAATREHTPEAPNVTEEEPAPSTPLDRSRLLADLVHAPGLLSKAQLKRYLCVWATECAPWLDMFDHARTFGLQVPCLAQRSPAVLYAMLALAARQIERTLGNGHSCDSIELYSKAIAALSAALEARDPCTLVTACILCVLEMMSASPQDWRRHLEGCAALFAAADVHGLSDSLSRAIFWCYARMDLCSAIMSDGTASTVFPVRKWFAARESEEYCPSGCTIRQAILDECRTSPDMHSNYMVYLTARVCDLLAHRTRQTELNYDDRYDDGIYVDLPFDAAWKALWEEVQSWYTNRPLEMLPVVTVTGAALFPRALYAHYAAISSTQLYHTACILMLDMRCHHMDFSPQESMRNQMWHARCVIGISLANPHKGCLNNAVQPIYIAGRFFSHREEHAVIVNLLKTIESGSGWAARWRIPDLEVAWGYPPGTFSKNSPA